MDKIYGFWIRFYYIIVFFLIITVTIKLQHGSVLLMNPPTNEIWYHSLPTRKKILGSRINLTFRKMRQISK